MAAKTSVSGKRFTTVDQLVDEALSVSVNSSSRSNPTSRCCRCHDTGSCSNCSCKKAGRGCSQCLPLAQGNCLNHHTEREQLPSNDLPVFAGSVNAAPASERLPSSDTCSCCQETRDELIALRKAVEDLKATVLRLSSVCDNSSSTRPAVQLPPPNEKRSIRRPRLVRKRPEDDRRQKAAESAATSAPGKKRVLLEGKRKVWGSRKQTNANTIRQTIAKSTSLTEDSISVKRKFSLSNGKETRWWFVISGNESTLATLEHEWGIIQQKCNWKLLPCLVFDNSSDAQPAPESDSTNLSSTQIPGCLSTQIPGSPSTQFPVRPSAPAPCSRSNSPVTPADKSNGSSD